MSEKWTDWKGGKCPLQYGITVDVKDADGFIWEDVIIGQCSEVANIFWEWHKDNIPSNNIVAFRLK